MSTAELSVLFMCCCTVVADLYLIYVSWRKSPLGTIVALVILQILLGTAVVPIAIAAGLYGGSFHGNQYLLQNDPPGIAAAAHLGLFSIGGIVGWHFGGRSGFCRRAVTILSRPLLKLDAFRCAVCLLILSFGCYAILFIQIDWTVLLSNARGGSQDAYGASQGYLFLKSMASVGMWSVCFLPSILRYCNRRKIVFIAALILLYVCLTFVIAVSRNLLLWSILLPAIVLVRYSGVSRLVKCLAAMVVVVAASGVLLYGKSFSQVQRRLVSSGEWSSLESSSPEGFAVAVISNLDFQWFSVDAGITNFLAGGPMPVAEVGLAMAIGYVPSRMLESVGLGSLSYVSYGDEGIVPINSRYFSLEDGTVPPGTVGYSSYLGPWVMGFAVGFLLLCSLASVLQFSCHSGLGHRCSISWLFALLLVSWFSFIPMACALATFGALVIFGLSLTCFFAPS